RHHRFPERELIDRLRRRSASATTPASHAEPVPPDAAARQLQPAASPAGRASGPPLASATRASATGARASGGGDRASGGGGASGGGASGGPASGGGGGVPASGAGGGPRISTRSI